MHNFSGSLEKQLLKNLTTLTLSLKYFVRCSVHPSMLRRLTGLFSKSVHPVEIKPMARLRFLPNQMPDLLEGGEAIVPEADVERQIVSYIDQIKMNVVPNERNGKDGLYLGCGGVAYMFYHLSKVPALSKMRTRLLADAVEYLQPALKVCTYETNDTDVPAFLLGNCGVYAVAAAVYHATGDEQECVKYRNMYNKAAAICKEMNFHEKCQFKDMSAKHIIDHSSDSGLSEMTFCSGEMPSHDIFTDITFDDKLSSRAVVNISDVLKNQKLVVEHNLQRKLLNFLTTSESEMEADNHKREERMPLLLPPGIKRNKNFEDNVIQCKNEGKTIRKSDAEQYSSSIHDERNDDEVDDSESVSESEINIECETNNSQPDNFLKDFLCLTVKSSGDNRTCMTSQPILGLSTPIFSSSIITPRRKIWNHNSIKLFKCEEIKSNSFIFKNAIFPQFSLLAGLEDSLLVRSKPAYADLSWQDKNPNQMRRKTSSSEKVKDDICSNNEGHEELCMKSEVHSLMNAKQKYDSFYQTSESELSSITNLNKDNVIYTSPGKSMLHKFPKLSSEESSDEGSYKIIKKRKRRRRTCSNITNVTNDNSHKSTLTTLQPESLTSNSNLYLTVSQKESQNLSFMCTGSASGSSNSRSNSLHSDTLSDLISTSDDDSDSNKMQHESLKSMPSVLHSKKNIFSLTSNISNQRIADAKTKSDATVTTSDHFVFKKPVFVKPTQINQNLRADIDCFVQKKEDLRRCTKSSLAAKTDDDQLSIFVESDLTDFEIESDEENKVQLSPTESIINDWDNLSVHSNNAMLPPVTHNISSSVKGNVKPRTMLHPKHVYVHPKDLLLNVCYYHNLCRDSYCNKSHNLPENFRDMVLKSSHEQVRELYTYICTNYRALAAVLPFIIEYLGIHQEKKLLVGLIRDIFVHYKLQKESLIQQIISILMDMFKKNFENVVKWLLSQYTEIHFHNVLIKHLIVITISEPDFFIKLWTLFRFLIEEYKKSIPINIVSKILDRCLSVQEQDRPQCLLQIYDFLKQPLVKFSGLEYNLLLRRFMMDLYELNAECAKDINKKFYEETGFNVLPPDYFLKKTKQNSSLNYGFTASSTYESTRIANIDNAECGLENSMCDIDAHDAMKLSTYFINGNIVELCALLEKYKQAKYMNSLVAHTHIIYKKIEHQVFHNVLLQMLTKLRETTEPEMVICTRHITINVLPLYDLAKDYKSAGSLILLFRDNLLSFTNSTIYWNKAPYLLNSFKSIPQKLVFIMKILTRGNCLHEAFEIIRLSEFELRNNKSSSLYIYKLSKVKEFLQVTAATKWKLFGNVVYHFLDEESTMINNELDIPKMFDDFIICILKDYILKKNIEHLNRLQKLITKHHFYLKPNTLRAVLVVMSEQNINLRPYTEVFDYLCGMNIYCNQEDNFNSIHIKSNIEREEIKMNLKFFFIRMLEKNISPRQIDFNIIISNHESELFLPEILVPVDRTDAKTMHLRLVIAFMDFNPRIELMSQIYLPKIILSVDDVKKILQYYQRIM